ncbi:hypothetical protein BX589_114135 [Paraburkholderia fungorum]|jgi:hypothetical protein|uniref:DUF6817 domain-containing protein n=1 Tax=Paraburkholderia fungorum TaxID=134537 RepID=UPI000D0483B3|nr:hypothetical protein [Paraburkholderia fungorum]PRZ52461.1 hypothetical protein BX589_114135 [Paraburkholderia fungorum]
MTADFELAAPVARAIAFLRARGADSLQHSGANLLRHLLGTYDILAQLGAPAPIALAGLVHSVHGTAAFEHAICPWNEASMIAELVGPQAARIAWLFCRLDRRIATIGELISGCRPSTIDRITREPLTLAPVEVVGLAWIEAANLLEQNALANAPVLARCARDWGMIGPHGFRLLATRPEAELLLDDPAVR